MSRNVKQPSKPSPSRPDRIPACEKTLRELRMTTPPQQGRWGRGTFWTT